jgi:molecular chaperone HscB
MPSAADKNHFELFGLPVTFDLDVPGLSARYRELAREAHPDRFAGGSDFERRLAMQMTTRVNEAFRVLKSPISRASYLLELKGARAAHAAAVDPAFLVEQMELRERLESVCHERNGLAALARDVREALAEREQSLGRSLSPDKYQPERALRTVQEMQYLEKLRQQIADLEDDIQQ